MEENKKHICPNCDQEFDKDFSYCPHCGQKNSKQRIGLKDFVTDYLAANFNFDSKILLTLKLLLFKPAFLTKEFFKGRQTKYIPPIRLYLFISLAYFFIFSIGLPSANDFVDDTEGKTTADSTKAAIENSITLDSTGFSLSIGSAPDEVADTSHSAFGDYLQSKFDLLDSEVGEAQMYENFKKYTSTGMFFLLPFVALILSLVFFRKKFYIENLLFAVHLQSALFLIGTFFGIIHLFFDSSWIIFIELLIFIGTSFIWIKNYYELTVWQTIGKQLLFYIAYFIIFIIYII